MPIVLRDYQQKIVDELKTLPASSLLMKTGTGKTYTSLELVKYNDTSNLLVVCPHSAITQWKKAIKEFFPHYNIIDLKQSWSSSKINDFLGEIHHIENKAIIINYDMIHRVERMPNLINPTWTIIADEIHRIKNYGTQKNPVKATRYMLRLGINTPYKIGLTATPTQGNYGGYIDYYPQITFLGYTDLDYDDFYKRYVVYENKHFGTSPFPIKTIIGYKNTHEIDALLKVIARRYSPQYGDFEPQFNKILLERPKGYQKLIKEKAYIKDDVNILLTNSARARIAKKTYTTGVILGHDMTGETFACKDNNIKIDWLEDFLKDTDEVVSIFYTYNVELASLVELAEKLGKKYIVVNGKTKDKYDLVNNTTYNLVIGQFKAMSEALDGLHLKCHIEVFFSMPESSLIYTQAIGRIDRIGQKEVPMYYFLIMEKTIDEAIMENIENKIEFSEETLNKLEV
jgi:hypothetical protein